MEARLLYWTWALANMVFAIGLAIEGVRRIRRRELRVHKRLMVAAGLLVALFVLSYGFKLAFLGKEDLSRWSDASILVLRVHESCVLAMLLGGAYAGVLAYCFLREASDSGSRACPSAWSRRHRRAGWIAIVASSLGALTAGLVLQGMYERAKTASGSAELSPRRASVAASAASLREARDVRAADP